MGSPLSSIVANLYMKWFESKALYSFPLKLEWWDRHLDDTNMDYPNKKDSHEVFYNHVNLIDDGIQFTKEIEHDGKLSFLDVLVHKKYNEEMGHVVYKKNTWIFSFMPHLIIIMLKRWGFSITRALKILDNDYIHKEKMHLAKH